MATQLNNWLSIDKVSGTGNAEITLTASSYEELVDRATSLKIQGISANAILNVRQNAIVPSATLDSYEITAYGGGTYTNGITSNVPWTAVVNGDWITIDKTQGGSGYTPLSITLDASTETRNGSIVFNAEGVVLTLQIYQIYDLKKSYFWVEFEGAKGTISGLTNTYTDMHHSFDGITWLTTPKTLSMGDNTLVYFKNNNKKIPNLNIKFNSNARVGGDISSITNMERECCSELFRDNQYLTDASQLILPWTTLADGCYGMMFQGCTSLTTAPELPATTLANGCYGMMFKGCTNLTSAPVLSATTLAQSCYEEMFRKCTSLTKAPELPATTLAERCYKGMFSGCSSLVNAPTLPATTLAGYCYYDMFSGCSSLVSAPELPATTLAEWCYGGMFYICESLVIAPALPATTLADNCYKDMFAVCKSLVYAPSILPATTLANGCYYNMFITCLSLKKAPELPATTLVGGCYRNMFMDCKSLNYIKMLAIKYRYDSLEGWTKNVASSGTFVKHPDAANPPRGDSGIPQGWKVGTATS